MDDVIANHLSTPPPPPPAVKTPSIPAIAALPAREARKLRPFVALGVLSLIAIAGGSGYVALHAGKESTDDAQVEADVVALAPRVSGRIARVLVRDNQAVQAGTVVLQLEDADQTARVHKAEAELAIARAEQRAAEAQELIAAAGAQGGLDSAHARLSSSRVDVTSADTQIAVARAALERARTDAQRAALDLGRVRTLRQTGAVTAEQLDNAQIADAASRAAVAQAEAALAVAAGQKRAAQTRVAEAAGRVTASAPIDAQLEAARAHTELARARVQASSATLELARLDLSYTQVRAPRAGTIAQLRAREGQLLAVGQPVAELVPSETYLVANFKETQIARMRPGAPVEIVLDAYPGERLTGKVESMAGGTGARFSLLPADNASGNFVKVVQRIPVRIAWQRPPARPLAVGLSAEATVDVN
jgi:membrane fusion protein, multidrug efflux system